LLQSRETDRLNGGQRSRQRLDRLGDDPLQRFAADLIGRARQVLLLLGERLIDLAVHLLAGLVTLDHAFRRLVEHGGDVVDGLGQEDRLGGHRHDGGDRLRVQIGVLDGHVVDQSLDGAGDLGVLEALHRHPHLQQQLPGERHSLVLQVVQLRLKGDVGHLGHPRLGRGGPRDGETTLGVGDLGAHDHQLLGLILLPHVDLVVGHGRAVGLGRRRRELRDVVDVELHDRQVEHQRLNAGFVLLEDLVVDDDVLQRLRLRPGQRVLNLLDLLLDGHDVRLEDSPEVLDLVEQGLRTVEVALVVGLDLRVGQVVVALDGRHLTLEDLHLLTETGDRDRSHLGELVLDQLVEGLERRVPERHDGVRVGDAGLVELHCGLTRPCLIGGSHVVDELERIPLGGIRHDRHECRRKVVATGGDRLGRLNRLGRRREGERRLGVEHDRSGVGHDVGHDEPLSVLLEGSNW
jgi:hypothetical protein